MRHLLSLALIGAFIAAQPVPQARAQSFSCAGNITVTEAAICNDAGLASMDEALSARYRAVRARLAPGGRARLLALQRQFLANRDRCAGEPDCIGNVYASMIGVYNALLD